MRHLLCRATFLAGLIAFLLHAGAVPAQAPAALTGVVTSAEEGPMEGVLVSAKKADSTVTVTVVTDAQGRYRFPATRLDPGKYALRIRAAGYDLDGRTGADVAAQKTATVDLKLRRTQDLPAQLSNAEWILSAPGTEQQKRSLLGCVGCHTLERVMRSKYDAAGLQQTLARMAGYANQSTPLHPQRRLADRDREMIGEDRVKFQRAQAEWLASVNLSGGSTWDYPLKTLPRPKGRGTQVVITEYDLPRPTIEPHDVIADADGMVWYSSFGEQFIGRLDPKSGKVAEYPVPELKKGSPTGLLSLRADRDGNLWAGLMYQAAIAKVDRSTGKLQVWSVPPEIDKANTQINMTSPWNHGVDNRIWTQNNGFAGVHRVDLATGKWETWEPFKASKKNHNIYDVVADSNNNAYFTDFANEHIGRIDARTGKVTLYETPTKASAPRRGMMDAQDRLWFAQYRGNRIAMFDTRSEKFEEWEAPTPWAAPYDIALDRNGEVWTGSMLDDRVLRLDPKTGRFVQYLLPRPTNIRRVFVDSSSTPVAFWVGSNHGASIVKLEPLD
ncbi:MAG TPA: carboxypeptidase regulatory-like domain-containing protein [Burkholderiales bacterium]|nr:carboxypeptidase regulatory-like domain-containing protein [Burkholderiales bacterium]